MASARIIPTQDTLLARRITQLREQVTTEPLAEAYERVIGTNDLVPIAYLRQGLKAANAVCLVQIDDNPKGSGFIIGNGLLLTNNHVLKDEAVASRGTAVFNYQLDEQGDLEPTATFRLRPDVFFSCSEPAALDYAVVAVEPTSLDGRHQLASYGILALSAEVGKAYDGEFLTIIQHPRGSYKKVGLRENKFLGYADSTKGPANNQWYIDYTTDTLPGSSGAPVLNDQWQLVALHSCGVEARNAAGDILMNDGITVYRKGFDDENSIKWDCNRGVRASRILLDLTARNPGKALVASLPGNESVAPSKPVNAADMRQPIVLDTKNSLLPARESLVSSPNLSPLDMQELKLILPLELTLRIGEPILGQTLPVVSQASPPPTSLLNDITTSKAFESVPSSRPNYGGRSGYEEGFLKNFPISLKDLLASHLAADKLAPLLDGSGFLLNYTHFTTAQHRIRRLPVLTAVNIRGKQFDDIKRTKDRWILDPRLDAKLQTGPAVYQSNDLDRGHMVRRQDPDWGTDALLANEDTFHYTNSCPQHKDLNQKDWNVLEDYILDAAKKEGLDVSVFTGPVFGDSDWPYRDVLLPLQFWKIAVMIKGDEHPSASGFLLSQESMLGSLETKEAIIDTGFNTYKTYQVSLRHIAELTGLDLSKLYPHDPLNGVEAFEKNGFTAIKSWQDISL